MPNWNPNWQDVRWDHGAATEAVAALRRAAAELDHAATERFRAALQATAEWRGVHRCTFDAGLQRSLAVARDLVRSYHAAAERIVQASQWARDEQHRRERERERWRRERDEEQSQPH